MIVRPKIQVGKHVPWYHIPGIPWYMLLNKIIIPTFAPLYTGHSYCISISAQNGYTMIRLHDITIRLMIISCNNIMLTISAALYAGSVDHVI